MRNHIENIIEELTRFRDSNHEPSIINPDNDFEASLNAYFELKALLVLINETIKPLKESEKALRAGIANSLREFFGDNLKEGVNRYDLSDGKSLKFTNKVSRDVDISMMQLAREEFEKTEDAPPLFDFDRLIISKLTVSKKVLDQLEQDSDAYRAVSRMLITKYDAAGLEID